MENQQPSLVSRYLMAFALILFAAVSSAQSTTKDKDLIKDSKYAIADFKRTDNSLSHFFTDAFGYCVFPNVGKGAVVVGGASGGGVLFQKDSAIGRSQMTQVTVGFQAGGQAYREIIFFEDQSTFERFKDGKFQLSAQVSAVAVTAGVGAKSNYSNGILVFTQAKGGLMYEASVGGQKFEYTAW